eukprot:3358964-Rhodomonas_salina.1
MVAAAQRRGAGPGLCQPESEPPPASRSESAQPGWTPPGRRAGPAGPGSRHGRVTVTVTVTVPRPVSEWWRTVTPAARQPG